MTVSETGEMNFASLKHELDMLVEKYEKPSFFIGRDPITIPHLFSEKRDIEVSAFLTSIITWGLREETIEKAKILMNLMDDSPYYFVTSASPSDMEELKEKLTAHSSEKGYFHRTLKATCLPPIIFALQEAYKERGSIESFFEKERQDEPLIDRMSRFYSFMKERVTKQAHSALASMETSSAKRANMFLRWMVRPCKNGVDFGIWKSVDASELYLPLDVHSARTARQLGLTKRMSNDRRTVEEITFTLARLCPNDPAKYDFALFGKGIEDKQTAGSPKENAKYKY